MSNLNERMNRATKIIVAIIEAQRYWLTKLNQEPEVVLLSQEQSDLLREAFCTVEGRVYPSNFICGIPIRIVRLDEDLTDVHRAITVGEL
jgi:hypothetical protein